VLLVAAGITAYYALPEVSAVVRGLGVALAIIAGAAVFAFTAKGRDTREFIAESRFEMRKVVWPTRQETWRMTLVVFVVVVIIALLIAAIDFLISSGVTWLLGQGSAL
jgi:preprotein translocase subunit SecE